MEENIIKMGNKVILMHTAVMDVLEYPDKEKELEIIQSDDRINHLEEKSMIRPLHPWHYYHLSQVIFVK